MDIFMGSFLGLVPYFYLSCFRTCTAVQTLCWTSPEGLHVSRQLPANVAPDLLGSFWGQPPSIIISGECLSEPMWECSGRTSGEFTASEWTCFPQRNIGACCSTQMLQNATEIIYPAVVNATISCCLRHMWTANCRGSSADVVRSSCLKTV